MYSYQKRCKCNEIEGLLCEFHKNIEELMKEYLTKPKQKTINHIQNNIKTNSTINAYGTNNFDYITEYFLERINKGLLQII